MFIGGYDSDFDPWPSGFIIQRQVVSTLGCAHPRQESKKFYETMCPLSRVVLPRGFPTPELLPRPRLTFGSGGRTNIEIGKERQALDYFRVW